MMQELDTDKFQGYISEIKDGVWISHIKSKNIGNGDFSELIKELKVKYNWIKIPTPSNMMIEIAEHLGLRKRKQWFGEPINEEGIVMYWHSPCISKFLESRKKIKTFQNVQEVKDAK